jgi:hypothetical protein
MKNRAPWYSRFGPFAWYRLGGGTPEWVGFDLSFRSHHFVSIHVRTASFSLLIGGRVLRRSAYGRPSAIRPRFSVYRPTLVGF